MEIDMLKEPIGKQDQYIAAYGGLACFRFLPNDQVEAWPLRMDTEALALAHAHPQAILSAAFAVVSVWGLLASKTQKPPAHQHLVETLKVIAPALDTASHLMRIHGSEEEAALFAADAKIVRNAIAKAH